jgi:hypothetical protein
MEINLGPMGRCGQERGAWNPCFANSFEVLRQVTDLNFLSFCFIMKKEVIKKQA